MSSTRRRRSGHPGYGFPATKDDEEGSSEYTQRPSSGFPPSAPATQSRPISPTIFPFGQRHRLNTNPSTTPGSTSPHNNYKQFASAFYTVNSKYRITWERRSPRVERTRTHYNTEDESKPPTPTPGSTPSSSQHGPFLASPMNMAWHASTGRHDLSQRQLVLLKEMLNNVLNVGGAVIAEVARGSLTMCKRSCQEEEKQLLGNDWAKGSAALFKERLPGEVPTKILDLSNPRWCYTDTEVRSDFDGLPAVLEPPKITTLVPSGLAFPLAPKFDIKHDTRFLRGCHYTTPHKPETLPLLEARLSRIVAPPQVSPRCLLDDKYEYDDLEGMIQLKPGIPFTYGMPNSNLLLTIACLHTPALMAEYGSDGLRAISLLDNLHQLTFGCKGNPGNNQPDILPIYRLKGNGEGSGCFMPAVQNDTSPACVTFKNPLGNSEGGDGEELTADLRSGEQMVGQRGSYLPSKAGIRLADLAAWSEDQGGGLGAVDRWQ
ncbi:hypothetical protein BDN71DRAFT_1432845 [Pleurotus eryngii]|uniref:Uncharacterized protein n=1 Tax=Pleurotus eryngii TaxID=5323 RepID=A0A9P5ZW70_PLEER|nr:hypothetical protein BDN71DRAFT_1432845 [Pleurotus eryngii]